MSHAPEALPWYAMPDYVQFGVPSFSDIRDAIRICKAFDKNQISLEPFLKGAGFNVSFVNS